MHPSTSRLTTTNHTSLDSFKYLKFLRPWPNNVKISHSQNQKNSSNFSEQYKWECTNKRMFYLFQWKLIINSWVIVRVSVLLLRYRHFKPVPEPHHFVRERKRVEYFFPNSSGFHPTGLQSTHLFLWIIDEWCSVWYHNLKTCLYRHIQNICQPVIFLYNIIYCQSGRVWQLNMIFYYSLPLNLFCILQKMPTLRWVKKYFYTFSWR